MTTLRTHVAAAAPQWVRDRLAGPVQECVVVHTGRHALYVSVSVGDDIRCVGLLSATSSMVPCGLRTTAADLDALAGGPDPVQPGDVLSVGAGLLRLATADVGVGRTVDLSAPQLDRAAAGSMSARLRTVLADHLEPVRSELPAAALAMLAHADPAAIPMLLGRGSGLTPVGDDVVCGWLATMWAARSDLRAIAAAAAELSTAATTLLSATLLNRATDGDVLPEFRHLLLTLRSGDANGEVLAVDVQRLLAIGHTSGAGLLLGCLLAFDHLNPRSQTP